MPLGKNSRNTVQGNHGPVAIGDNPTIVMAQESALKQRIRHILSSDTSIEGYFSELEIYTRQKTAKSIKGLNEKFKDAGLESYLEHAIGCKEKFAKHLLENMYSLSYQRMIYLLIDEAICEFQHSIYPLIDAKSSPAQIMDAVRTKVFDRFFEATCDVSSDFNRSQIEGLVYYVTGNCYLRWGASDHIQQG